MTYTGQSYPILLAPGAVMHTTYDDERVVLVGTHPGGFTAILSEDGYERLLEWKLTKLQISRGRVTASDGKSRRYGANVITDNDPSTNRVAAHCNGNFLDLRASNLTLVPRTLLKAAENSRHVKPDKTCRFVTIADGRVRKRRKAPTPAHQRLEAILKA